MTVNGSGNANAADEVDPRVGSGGRDRVEEVVDDRLHVGAERFDAAGREGGRDEAAQPAVVGRVDAEHVPRERRPGQALGHHPAAGGQRGVHVLGEACVVERGAGLLVADHEPGVVPVGERDRVHRAELADRGEQREGVVAVEGPPRSQRLGRRHGCPPRVGGYDRASRSASRPLTGADDGFE